MGTLRDYVRQSGLAVPVYTVCNAQELAVCQQVWEIALDELEVEWEMSDGYIGEARLRAQLKDSPQLVELILNGAVGEFFHLKPSETGPLKLAWVNSEKVVFEPVTLPGGKTRVQVEVSFISRA